MEPDEEEEDENGRQASSRLAPPSARPTITVSVPATVLRRRGEGRVEVQTGEVSSPLCGARGRIQREGRECCCCCCYLVQQTKALLVGICQKNRPLAFRHKEGTVVFFPTPFSFTRLSWVWVHILNMNAVSLSIWKGKKRRRNSSRSI